MKKIKIDEKIFRSGDIRGADEQYVKSQKIEPGSLHAKSAHGAVLRAADAYIIGRSIAQVLNPQTVCVGHDSRLTSPELYRNMIRGLCDGGARVVAMGIATSDLVYFAVGCDHYDVGVMITGSHTAKELNGIKICRYANGMVLPVHQTTGLSEIKSAAIAQNFSRQAFRGNIIRKNFHDGYMKHMLSYFPNYHNHCRQKIVFDAGNGTAGVTYDKIISRLNVEAVKLNFHPDGNFPKHNPDPAVFENMSELIEAVRQHDCDFGVAWDGDADRIAFISKGGEILTGSHIGTLMLPWVAAKHPSCAVVATPPMTKAFFELAEELALDVRYAPVGNSHVRHAMDVHSSPFGAEEADHFMFEESYGAESGILPLLILLERIKQSGQNFDSLFTEAKRGYYVSGDINLQTHDAQDAINKIEKFYLHGSLEIDKLDGLRVELPDYRFCIRPSSIDPVLRLNIESRSKRKMHEAAQAISRLVLQNT